VQHERALVWFRRDLRLEDHAALHQALTQARRVHCVFCFDSEILAALPSRCDRRVEFIWESVRELRAALQGAGGELHVLHGPARQLIPQLAGALGVEAVYCNRDYEPQARARDAEVEQVLRAAGRRLYQLKDQVIFDHDELMTRAGTPFAVFTPYKRAWLAALEEVELRPFAVAAHSARLDPAAAPATPTLEQLGFQRTNLASLRLPTGLGGARALFEAFLPRLDHYRERRDFPALAGPSYLSTHLRFGTISIRELVRAARARSSPGADCWLSELIWRDFYFMILFHHPRVVDHAFQRERDEVVWEQDPARFCAWCEGRTGYPLVDAALRQLNQTGYMHNRLRMVAASFLTKDLGLDWRLGERYFAAQLNDFDLAANNGGWQWAASTGCDAQPYFRVFNPVTQSQRFDPQGAFIRRYVPELAACSAKEIHAPWLIDAQRRRALGLTLGESYPHPLVDHATARLAAIRRFARPAR